jgi:hypothetical protein
MGFPSEIRAKIVMIGVSATVAVYACEAFLFWDPLELRGPHPPKAFDQRGYLDVVRDLRAKGIEAYPVLAATTWFDSPPTVDEVPLVPLSGVSHATTVMCNETGTYVTYQSDRFGFNGPDAQWDMPAEVALVGDSFVEGWCVLREYTFGDLIRRVFPGTVNVGYTGHGPLAELGTIREYVAPRQPAHVFWFFYEGNDLRRDLPSEMESDILRRYMEPGFTQQLQQHAPALREQMRRQFDSRLNRSEVERSTSRPLGVIKLRSLRALIDRVRVREVSPSRPVDRSADLKRILAEAKRSVDEWGGSLHFVYLPDLSAAIGEADPADHHRVLALAADLGLNIVDLLPDFKNHPAPRSLFPYEEGRHLVETRGLHYGPEGHRLVARRITQVIHQSRARGSRSRVQSLSSAHYDVR